jgi:hypothetical protein
VDSMSWLSTVLPIAITVCVSGVMIVVFGAIFIPIIVRMVRNSQVTGQVMKTGVDATATILSTWDTGMRINDDPQVGMKLQVQPPNGAPFQADMTKTVSIVQLAQFQPGAQLNVRYDPAKPGHVAIVSIAGGMMGRAGAGNPMAGSVINQQQTEQMLYQHQAMNEQIIRTGLQSAAKILQYLPMNITVNGNNPVVNLMLEVQPVSRPPFTALAQGTVVSEISIPKFQPGQMITVRYDPNDLTKVAVEHSGV